MLYIGPAVRKQSRDAIGEAVVDNPGHELRPGMFVTAELALGEQELPAVPRAAVREDGVQRHVFVATGDRREERLVKGMNTGRARLPVVRGLNSGARVRARARGPFGLGPGGRGGALRLRRVDQLDGAIQPVAVAESERRDAEPGGHADHHLG